MINVLIIDDHQVLSDGLKSIINKTKEINVKYQAFCAQDALHILRDDQDLNVVLLDINLPDKGGYEVCKIINKLYKRISVLTLSMYNEAVFIKKMVQAGAKGYLLKDAGSEEVIRAIKVVANGETYFSQAVLYKLLGAKSDKSSKTSSRHQKVTRREKEVLELIVYEYTTEEIAQKLFISTDTVMTHRKSLLRKLNARNTAGMVKAAYMYNLLGKAQ